MDDSNTDGDTFRIALEGSGIMIDREIDQAVAIQVMTLVMGLGGQRSGRAASGAQPKPGPELASTSTAAPDVAPIPIVPEGARLSLREYFDGAEPKRNPDKILTIAAYLEDHRGLQTFAKDAIKREFRNAGEPAPGNYARDFRWAVTNGWVASAQDVPGEFYMTSKGRQAIQDKFSPEVKKASSVSKGRRRRGGKKVEES